MFSSPKRATPPLSGPGYNMALPGRAKRKTLLSALLLQGLSDSDTFLFRHSCIVYGEGIIASLEQTHTCTLVTISGFNAQKHQQLITYTINQWSLERRVLYFLARNKSQSLSSQKLCHLFQQDGATRSLDGSKPT